MTSPTTELHALAVACAVLSARVAQLEIPNNPTPERPTK